MGSWLENLKKEKQERDQSSTLEREARELESKRQIETWAREAEQKKKLNREHLIESRKHYFSSNFPQMIKDLTGSTEYRAMEFGMEDRYGNSDRDKVEIELYKSESFKKSGVSMKRKFEIDIEFTHDGKINIRGDRRGSSTLNLYEWENSADIQEKALKKAYEHPRINVDRDSGGYDFGPGLSGIS